MRKRIITVSLFISIMLTACSFPAESKQKTVTYLDLFDTVTTVMGSGEGFTEAAQNIHNSLLFYHRLFDIYHDYEGINNLKTVNDQAGIAPVTVDPAIIELLLDCKNYYTRTGGKVNAAMGSILRLWHDARTDGLANPENAKLPDPAALEEAAGHTDFNNVIIDEASSTVYISDPKISLDVGAIAKGWAAQKIAETAPANMLISIGGNVCITGPKNVDGTPWVIGIQDPSNSSRYLHTLAMTRDSVVTSGDYQRSYLVDGKLYHHIIDPETAMPGTFWRSVTVICPDSGLADALSTALFLLPLEEGQALAQSFRVEVLWVNAAGEEFMTQGFYQFLERP